MKGDNENEPSDQEDVPDFGPALSSAASPDDPRSAMGGVLEQEALIEAEGRIKGGKLAGRTMLSAIMVVAIPVLFQQSMAATVGLIDKILAGRLPEQIVDPALDAIGIGSYISWFVGIAMAGAGHRRAGDHRTRDGIRSSARRLRCTWSVTDIGVGLGNAGWTFAVAAGAAAGEHCGPFTRSDGSARRLRTDHRGLDAALRDSDGRFDVPLRRRRDVAARPDHGGGESGQCGFELAAVRSGRGDPGHGAAQSHGDRRPDQWSRGNCRGNRTGLSGWRPS